MLDTKQLRRLGKTDIMVSPVGLGVMTWQTAAVV